MLLCWSRCHGVMFDGAVVNKCKIRLCDVDGGEVDE